MGESVDNYTGQSVMAAMERQAWKVWAAGLGVVLTWALLIPLAPLVKLYGFGWMSSSLYHFFHFICHQLPERSFFISSEQFAVCSRCTGVYFGLVLGFGVYPLWRRVSEVEPPARIWLFLAMVPIAIDWSLTALDIWANTQVSRVLTGLILGLACATFIIPAIVEITRNLSLRRRSAGGDV